MSRLWSEDPYWTNALKRYYSLCDGEAKQIVIDIDATSENLFNGDGPAYRALEAFVSVHKHEALEGYRGAPRIVLALLQILSEKSNRSNR